MWCRQARSGFVLGSSVGTAIGAAGTKALPACGLRRENRKGVCHMITISAFKWVPPFAQGQVRDLRARWALEEAGLPYKTRLLELGDQDKEDYRELQPFGQIPILEEDGLVLFESGDQIGGSLPRLSRDNEPCYVRFQTQANIVHGWWFKSRS